MFGSRLANTFCNGSLGEEEMIKTRKSLWAAGFALLVCIVLLIGTTFAWFTDSVSNNGNRIQAGKLDVDLLMDKSKNGSYTSIADGTGDIFSEASGNEINWEPGKTEIVYLGVQNKGSLALNYNIVLDITDGEPGLVGSLEYAVLDGAKASDLSGINNWQQIVEHEDAQTGDVTAGEITAAPNGTLDEIVNGETDETEYFALAVHMKEDAGNAFQNGTISIDVNVVAKQATAETDGFGSDQYDANSIYPVANKSELLEAFTSVDDGEVIILSQDITITSDDISEKGPTGHLEYDIGFGAKDVIVDLNDHNLTLPNFSTFICGENTVVRNGTIIAEKNDGYTTGHISYPLAVGGDAKNIIIENVEMFGGLNVCDGATVTLHDVDITGTDYYAVCAQGNSIVTIESGVFKKHAAGRANYFLWVENGSQIIINGGEFVDNNLGTGLYLPGHGVPIDNR